MTKQEYELDKFISDNEGKAASLASVILKSEISVKSLNAMLGCKNGNHNIDLWAYTNPEEYIFDLIAKIEIDHANKCAKYDFQINSASLNIILMLQNDFLKQYVEAFLTRIYCRKTKRFNTISKIYYTYSR